MKQVKIFLASSIVEFEHERNELMSYIHRLNEQYVKRGVFFDLVICENASNAMAATRKQDEYNEAIRSSQYVYVLVGDRMGAYTEEEFDVALDQFSRTGSPAIYTYFKRLPEGSEPDESVTRFVERLGEGLGHYYSEFDSVDSIKLNMIMELTRDPEVGGELRFQDGRAKVDGVEMMSVEGLPSYGGNEDLAAKRAEIRELGERIAELKREYAHEGDEGVWDEMEDLRNRRAALQSEACAIEDAILASCNLIMDGNARMGDVDERESRALKLMGDGNYKKAANVLLDKEWDEEARRKYEIANALRTWGDQYASGKLLATTALRASSMTEEQEQKVIDAFEAAMEASCRLGSGISVVLEYQRFLNRQQRLKDAERVGNAYQSLATIHGASTVDQVESCTLLAYALNMRGKLGEAVTCLQKASDLIEKNTLPPSVVIDLTTGRFFIDRASKNTPDEELERRLLGLLKDYESYFSQDIPDHIRRQSNIFNVLGMFYRSTNRIEEGLAAHEKAIVLRERNAQLGDDQYMADLMQSYNNYAYILHHHTERLEEALDGYQKALAIRRECAEGNPTKFTPGIALYLANIADVLRRLGRFDEAEVAIHESLKIRERLAGYDPDRYFGAFCTSKLRLADIIRDRKDVTRYEEANALYRTFLDNIRKKGKLTDIDSRDKKDALKSHAELLEKMGRIDEANTVKAELAAFEY